MVVLLIGIAGLALVGALVSDHPRDALEGWIDLVLPLCVVLIVSDLTHRHQVRQPVLIAFYAVTGGVLVVAYLALALGLSHDSRLRGSFFHPNMLASYLALGIPVLVYQVFSEEREDGPGVATLLLLLAASLGALFLTGSRAAWGWTLQGLGMVAPTIFPGLRAHAISFVLGWSLAVFFLGRCLLGSFWIGATLCLGLLAALSLFGLSHSQRPTSLTAKLVLMLALAGVLGFALAAEGQNSPVNRVGQAGRSTSLQARVHFWSAAARMALENPLVGLGPDGFHRHYALYQSDARFFSKFSHSLALSVASESGLIVFWLILFWLGAVIYQLWRNPDPEKPGLSWALLCGVLVFLGHACLDVQLQFPALGLTAAVLLGLALPPGTVEQEDKPRSEWSIRPSLVVQYPAAILAITGCLASAQFAFAAHHVRLAEVATKVGEHQASVDFYREASRLDPFQGEHYRRLALVGLTYPGEAEISPQELERLSRLALVWDGHRAVSHNLRGRVLERLGQDGRADFRRALELDPNNYPSFYRDLARSYRHRRQFEPGRQLLQQALRRFPEELLDQVMDFREDTLRVQLAGLHEELGFVHLADPQGGEAARRSFQKAIELGGTDLNRKFGMGLALFGLGRLEEARELLQEVVKTDPEASQASEILEAVEAELGRSVDPAQVTER